MWVVVMMKVEWEVRLNQAWEKVQWLGAYRSTTKDGYTKGEVREQREREGEGVRVEKKETQVIGELKKSRAEQAGRSRRVRAHGIQQL